VAEVAVLDDQQRSTVAGVEQWMLELVAQGLVGLSPLLLDRGAALATELRQSDLPRSANLLNRSLASCQEISAGAVAHAPTGLVQNLSELWAVLSGLQTSPPPMPFRSLAGEHRRTYRMCPSLSLIALGPELWETPTGYRGYTVHFLDTMQDRLVTFSEARGPKQDPTWQPARALKSAELAGRRVSASTPFRIQVERVAVSADGRLASRRTSRSEEPEPISPARLLGLADTQARLRARFCQAIDAHPIGTPEPQWGLLSCSEMQAPRFDPYREAWLASATDGCGERFTLYTEDQSVVQALEREHGAIRAVFGPASLAGGEVLIRPVTAFTSSKMIPFTCQIHE
jgi:hypothetical protein